VSDSGWSALERYAAWVRGKPTWDAEEREPRLAVAAALREAIAQAAAGTDWQTPLRDCMFAPGYPRADLTLRGQPEWLRPWLDAGDDRLRAALAGFGDSERSPEERFESWARLCAAAISAGLLADRADAVLGFGALLNFATDPERVPFFLHKPFTALQRLLGEAPAADYGAHLRFARELSGRLTGAGIARDVLDAWALGLSAARNAGFWEPGSGVRGGARSEAPAHYLAVCAIYRDEASYLEEWVEFHRVVGVERFFLYDNNSTDDHREVLAPYVERGEVEIHTWPDGMGQRSAYDDCIARHGADARWIAFIDLDEFLFSPTGRPLPEVLTRYERWPAVGANWAVFGSSGHVTRPAGLVTESYLDRLRTGQNRTIKSVVDPLRVERCVGVHRFLYTELGAVDENEFPITGGQTKTESRSLLQVNHYMSKSLEEYRLRSERGRPVHDRRGEQFRRTFDPELLALQEQLGERDEAIQQYVPALKAALGR
jgi:hypothetical protein